MEGWLDISAKQFVEGIEKGDIDPRRVIDIRELPEWEYYHLPGTVHMPMQTIPDRMAELAPEEEWYMLCAHGVRSVYACRYLHEKGYGLLRNVSGGIAAAALIQGFRYD